ncbi:hypothetical protein QBD00_004593 [Ochrobactrum sp. AN78]|nr:hypothetical protein [Ochrobactrum sp. AN78]
MGWFGDLFDVLFGPDSRECGHPSVGRKTLEQDDVCETRHSTVFKRYERRSNASLTSSYQNPSSRSDH